MTDSISIRRVVRRTIAIYVAQARVLLSLAAVAVVVLTVLDAGLARSVPVLGIFVFIASIAMFALFTGMVVMLAANIWEERPAMTVRELVAAVRPMLGELVLVGFVALIAISFCYSFASTLLLVLALGVIIAGAGAHVGGFVVIAGLGVIVLLVPGTYLLTVWSVALPVVVLERPGGLRALRRSRELVRGNRWRVLGLALLFAVTVGVGIRALDLAAGSAGQDPGIAVAMLAAILLTSEVRTLVRETSTEQHKALILTAAFTGLRMGELLALRWGEVDFAAETIRVVRSFTIGGESSPKSGKPRSVPMVSEVATALARLGQREHFTGEGDLVFAGVTGRHVDSKDVRAEYKAALARAGLRNLRFHDLRHTFGTRAVEQAESILELKEWMGHANVQTTMRYLHYKSKADAAQRLAAAFADDDVAEASPESVAA